MTNAKPLVKSISSPPINPNPTVEEIKNPSIKKVVNTKKVNDRRSLKKPTKNTKTTPKKVPNDNRSLDATFERWKKQNGFS